jgi:hypothetical protein
MASCNGWSGQPTARQRGVGGRPRRLCPREFGPRTDEAEEHREQPERRVELVRPTERTSQLRRSGTGGGDDRRRPGGSGHRLPRTEIPWRDPLSMAGRGRASGDVPNRTLEDLPPTGLSPAQTLAGTRWLPVGGAAPGPAHGANLNSRCCRLPGRHRQVLWSGATACRRRRTPRGVARAPLRELRVHGC